MKIITVADLHLKLWNDKQIGDDGIPLKLTETLNVFEDICIYAKENGIPEINILGDINDLKNIVHARAFVLFQQILEKYSDIHFIILHGNHDSSTKIEQQSAIQLLDGLSNVTTIIEPTVIDQKTYIPHSGNLVDHIVEAEPNKIMFGHLGLSDATVASGISIRTRISSNDLKKFDLVVLGHYHNHQQVGHVYYTGSLIQLRRDEAGNLKRFLVIDTDTLEIESIPTKGYRKYQELIIEREEDIEEVLKQSKEYTEAGDYVRVHNQVKELPKDAFDGISVVDEVVEDYQIRGITTAMTIVDQMKKYLEVQGIPENQYQHYLDIGTTTLERFIDGSKE